MHDEIAFQTRGREDLMHRARALGVTHAESLTRVELAEEIARCDSTRAGDWTPPKGWFGAARAFTATVVERRLKLPDAAALIRAGRLFKEIRPPLPVVGVVTQAEICAAQGHLPRAIAMLDSVLSGEPGHERALALRAEFTRRILLEASGEQSGPPGLDRLVTLRTSAGRSCVYWERQFRVVQPQPHIRIVELRRTDRGTRREVRTVEPRECVGGVVIDDIGSNALVRAAIGFECERHFRPLAVGVEARVNEDGGIVVTWCPPRRGEHGGLLDRAANFFSG